MNSRQKRRYRHGIQGKYDRLIKKLRKAKTNVPPGEKPKAVKTHLRNCIIVPEMCNSIVDVYGGKYWNPVEVKADMVGHFLAEFSLTYKPIRHGRVGKGATRSSKFVSNLWATVIMEYDSIRETYHQTIESEASFDMGHLRMAKRRHFSMMALSFDAIV